MWKSVLLALTANLVLYHKHKASGLWIGYQIALSKSPRIEWSAFTKLALQMVRDAFIAMSVAVLLCGMNNAANFLLFLSLEWPVTWSDSSLHFPVKIFSCLQLTCYSKPNHLKWHKTYLLTTCSVDDLEGNTLLWNVWKIDMYTYHHWQAITLLIWQVNVLQYNTLNSISTYYFEIRQAISQ